MGYLGKGPGIRTVLLIRHKSVGLSYVRTLLMSNPLRIYCARYLVGLAGRAAYVASKHGVVGITRTAALEYAQQGIRVNCVCPGYIRTPMVAYVLQQAGAQLEKQMEAREPIGRLGTPEEVAETVVWLCSDASSFVTGHTMAVDGGFVAQ